MAARAESERGAGCWRERAQWNNDWVATKTAHLVKRATYRQHDILTAALPAPYFSPEDGISGYASRAIPGRISEILRRRTGLRILTVYPSDV
jgi:hypothetical protein